MWAGFFSSSPLDTKWFPCESGTDAGGLIHNFFTLTMRDYALTSGLLLGGSSSACLKAILEKVLECRFLTLAQLVGMAIVNVGKWPQCINEIVTLMPSIVGFEDNV